VNWHADVHLISLLSGPHFVRTARAIGFARGRAPERSTASPFPAPDRRACLLARALRVNVEGGSGGGQVGEGLSIELWIKGQESAVVAPALRKAVGVMD
jgi:hypothetical protein